MFRKLGVLSILVSLALISAGENSLTASLEDPKLEGKWRILEKKSDDADFMQVGEIEFKKERDGKVSGTITNNVPTRIPNGGTVTNINYARSRLTFEIRYNNSDPINFELSVDEGNRFYGRAKGRSKGEDAEARLEK